MCTFTFAFEGRLTSTVRPASYAVPSTLAGFFNIAVASFQRRALKYLARYRGGWLLCSASQSVNVYRSI